MDCQAMGTNELDRGLPATSEGGIQNSPDRMAGLAGVGGRVDAVADAAGAVATLSTGSGLTSA
jgi:hypothetical protein